MLCVLIIAQAFSYDYARKARGRQKRRGAIKGKKVVVITGSPRKGGNSFAMVNAFVDATEKLGHEVTRFDAAFMKIGGCHACETCYSAGKEGALIACCEEEDPTVLDGVRVPEPKVEAFASEEEAAEFSDRLALRMMNDAR